MRLRCSEPALFRAAKQETPGAPSYPPRPPGGPPDAACRAIASACDAPHRTGAACAAKLSQRASKGAADILVKGHVTRTAGSATPDGSVSATVRSCAGQVAESLPGGPAPQPRHRRNPAPAIASSRSITRLRRTAWRSFSVSACLPGLGRRHGSCPAHAATACPTGASWPHRAPSSRSADRSPALADARKLPLPSHLPYEPLGCQFLSKRRPGLRRRDSEARRERARASAPGRAVGRRSRRATASACRRRRREPGPAPPHGAGRACAAWAARFRPPDAGTRAAR